MAANKKRTSKDSIGTSIDAGIGASSKSNLIGQDISINLQKTTFFGVGNPFKIWLSPKNYWAPITDELDEKDIATIRKGLADGKLVKGKKFIPPVERSESVLIDWFNKIKSTSLENRGHPKTKELLKELRFLANKGEDKGWSAKEIGEYCIEKEKSAANRKKTITVLNTLIRTYTGPLKPWPEPEEEPGFKSTIENTSGTNKSESSSELLGQAFN